MPFSEAMHLGIRYGKSVLDKKAPKVNGGPGFCNLPTGEAAAASNGGSVAMQLVEASMVGRVVVDQVGPHKFMLTDIVTLESVELPPGTYELYQDLEQDYVSIVGVGKNGLPINLEVEEFHKSILYDDLSSGIFVVYFMLLSFV